ncbi:hypothetical protein [Celeribacter sp.]|uniref:hypothetical protein n=1 Tax=Celeribacter sp. TaxID=1890673 RepID=UPI003A90C2A1
MDMTQKTQFTDRIARIQAGGPNTFGTVYCGVQNSNAPKRQKVKVTQAQSLQERSGPSKMKLMRVGLQSGLMKVSLLSVLVVGYIRYVGI